MSKNTRWSSDDFKNAGLIEVPGRGFIKSDRLVAQPDNKPVGNKKIRNATKSEVDGVKFDSQLERYMYEILKGAGVHFDFQVEYVLQEKFRYGTDAIRAITLTVDFVLTGKNMIIDTKGFMNDRAPMKIKMLKRHLLNTQPDNLPTIELPSNKKECDELLNRLLYEK